LSRNLTILVTLDAAGSISSHAIYRASVALPRWPVRHQVRSRSRRHCREEMCRRKRRSASRARERPEADAQTLLLFLAANPREIGRLQLDEEYAAIVREFRMTAARDGFDVRAAWAVTIDEMMRQLYHLQPAIIHFGGHGAATPGAGIYLETEHRHPQFV